MFYPDFWFGCLTRLSRSLTRHFWLFTRSGFLTRILIRILTRSGFLTRIFDPIRLLWFFRNFEPCLSPYLTHVFHQQNCSGLFNDQLEMCLKTKFSAVAPQGTLFNYYVKASVAIRWNFIFNCNAFNFHVQFFTLKCYGTMNFIEI